MPNIAARKLSEVFMNACSSIVVEGHDLDREGLLWDKVNLRRIIEFQVISFESLQQRDQC